MRVIASVLIAVALTGCHRMPEIPLLDSPPPKERVALDGKLEVSDFRAIFQSINAQGKLDGLKPYFQADDATLAPIAEVVSRQLYETALSRDGLLDSLSRAIQEGRFEAFHDFLGSHSSLRRTGAILLEQSDLLPVLERNLPLLSSPFQEIVDQWNPSPIPGTWPKSPPVTREQFALEADWWVKNGRGFEPQIQGLNDSQLMEGLFESLAVSTSAQRRGLAKGISRMWRQEKSLQDLFTLFSEMNQNTEGLFETVQKGLVKNSDNVQQLVVLLNRMLPITASQLVKRKLEFGGKRSAEVLTSARWKALAKAKTDESWEWAFWIFHEALESLATVSLTGTDTFLREMSFTLNAYSLANWLEETAKLNPEVEANEIWKLPIENFPEQVTVAENGYDGKWKLLPQFKTRLTAMGLTEFLEKLEANIQFEGFGEFYTQFSDTGETLTLERALKRAVVDVDSYRPMGDFTPAVQLLMEELRTPRSPFQFALWESENFLVDLNEWAVALSPESWRIWNERLFQTWKVHRLEPDIRDFLLQFYRDDENLKGRMEKILGVLPALESFLRDQPEISPFEIYQQWLRHVPSVHFPSVGHLVEIGNRSQLFDPAQHPTAEQWLGDGRVIFQTLDGLSSLSKDQREWLAQQFQRSLGTRGPDSPSGVQPLLTALGTLKREDSTTLTKIYEEIQDSSWPPTYVGDSLSQLALSGDLATLWLFVASRSSRQEIHLLLQELEALAEDGTLVEAGRRLQQFSDPRIARLGTVLERWVKSGEFIHFTQLLVETFPLR